MVMLKVWHVLARNVFNILSHISKYSFPFLGPLLVSAAVAAGLPTLACLSLAHDTYYS